MKMEASSDRFLFEEFRLDRLGGGLLRRDDQGAFVPVAIGSRALDILAALIERRGDIVSKEEIIAAVWPKTVVEENNLFVQISALRRILGAVQSGQSCIQTVIGRGYRFVAPVTRVELASPPISSSISGNRDGSLQVKGGHGDSLAAALPNSGKPSIAVLPFANLSGDAEQEYFVDGMVEEIITALSRIRWLSVIARNSTFTYKGQVVDVKQVGRELGVRYALEGSVRKAGGRVRITAQLIDALTGAHLWAERYDRDLSDLFALQDEITEAVTIAIAPAVSEAERQ